MIRRLFIILETRLNTVSHGPPKENCVDMNFPVTASIQSTFLYENLYVIMLIEESVQSVILPLF